MSNSIEELSKPICHSLIAPAGCGKTMAIALGVPQTEGRQLILTHTHAGVRSLKQKLHLNHVADSKFNLETLDGWFLKYVLAFPSMSGLRETNPTGDLWSDVRSAMENLFSNRIVREIITTTYRGAYIDEYQDCSLPQHAVILKLAELIPVRVLGDPLQGILGFDKNPLIEWESDVLPVFPRVEELNTPWRWKDKNPALGNWFQELRINLLCGKRIDLSKVEEISWYQSEPQKLITTTKRIMHESGSFVAIQMWPNSAHNFAKNFGGKLQSMEEMECKDLMKAANSFDNLNGLDLIRNVIEFICMCMSRHGYLEDVERRVNSKSFPNFLSLKNKEMAVVFQELTVNRDYSSMAKIIKMTLDDKALCIHRRELLTEMLRSLDEMVKGNYKYLSEAAWEVRTRTRRFGGNLGKKIVSRPPLIKGLEFDNVLIVNSDTLAGINNFYVAATRATRSLTIFSSNPLTYYTEKKT